MSGVERRPSQAATTRATVEWKEVVRTEEHGATVVEPDPKAPEPLNSPEDGALAALVLPPKPVNTDADAVNRGAAARAPETNETLRLALVVRLALLALATKRAASRLQLLRADTVAGGEDGLRSAERAEARDVA